MDSKETKFITITAKNSETVEFRKFNSIAGNVAVYDENASFSKQLSTNCGVFIFDIKENKNGEEIDTDKKLLVIVTSQYGDKFANIEDIFLNTDVKIINKQDDFNKLLFQNKNDGLFFKGDEGDEKDEKSKISLTLSEIPDDKITEIYSLIEKFNNITGCTELNDKNKDTKITINEPITITPFAFDVAGLFEFIAREKIREIINKNQLKEPDWEVLDGNINPHDVLIEKPKEKNKKEFHINGEVKPDIIIHNKNTDKCIIIDAKYKSPDKNDREDRLQILAYAYLYDAHIVGHIFPTHDKSSGDNNKKELKFHKLNTSLGNYNYVQLYLDDKNLSENIKKIIKKTEEICDKENEQNGNQ